MKKNVLKKVRTEINKPLILEAQTHPDHPAGEKINESWPNRTSFGKMKTIMETTLAICRNRHDSKIILSHVQNLDRFTNLRARNIKYDKLPTTTKFENLQKSSYDTRFLLDNFMDVPSRKSWNCIVIAHLSLDNGTTYAISLCHDPNLAVNTCHNLSYVVRLVQENRQMTSTISALQTRPKILTTSWPTLLHWPGTEMLNHSEATISWSPNYRNKMLFLRYSRPELIRKPVENFADIERQDTWSR